jgi:hypothetical protein
MFEKGETYMSLMNGQRNRWGLLLLPKEPIWWMWLMIACALATGLAGYFVAFFVATSLSAAQALYFLWRDRSFRPMPVQIRVAYTVLLMICLIPGLHWFFWAPTFGTVALVAIGYCMMGRFLSLMPWNRTEPISIDLLRHTFLTPPTLGAIGGLSLKGCHGGVCSIEAQIGLRPRASFSGH